jgi:hypothetical protein
MMKRLAFLLMGLVALAGSAVFAFAEPELNLPYGSERMWKMTHDVDKMVGAGVTDREGRVIAKVKDFVTDEKGRITFAILDDSQGKASEHLVAVPYEVLFYNDTNQEFITDITREHLASAPEIKDTADLAGHAYAEKVYRYFGVRPSWESGESSGEMME